MNTMLNDQRETAHVEGGRSVADTIKEHVIEQAIKEMGVVAALRVLLNAVGTDAVLEHLFEHPEMRDAAMGKVQELENAQFAAKIQNLEGMELGQALAARRWKESPLT